MGQPNDPPADREAWFKAVELAIPIAQTRPDSDRYAAAFSANVLDVAKDLYVILASGWDPHKPA